ncbi:MAG: TetR/AcrR family transcriptional regulator [Treponemataceae bacterium]
MKEHIIINSTDLFCIYGVRGVSMEYISQKLGISKRTLYEHFNSKEELIQLCVEYIIRQKHFFVSKGNNLLDDLLHCCKLTNTFLQMTHYNHLFDIWRFHSNTFTLIQQQIVAYAQMCSEKLEDCKIKGYIRLDISSVFISELIKGYLLKLFFCKRCFQLNTTNQSELLLQFVVRGISTVKGQAYIDYKLIHWNDEIC